MTLWLTSADACFVRIQPLIYSPIEVQPLGMPRLLLMVPIGQEPVVP